MSDSLNIFDAVIVVISLIEIILTRLLAGNADLGPITVFRTFRLLRLFKLARRYENLKNLIAAIGKCLSAIPNFAILLVLFMFI